MPTDKQIEASKINRAKSQGPKTPKTATATISPEATLSSSRTNASMNSKTSASATTMPSSRPMPSNAISLTNSTPPPGAWPASALWSPWRQEKTHAKTFAHNRHVLTFLNMDNEEDAPRRLLRYQALPPAEPTTLSLPSPSSNRSDPSRNLSDRAATVMERTGNSRCAHDHPKHENY